MEEYRHVLTRGEIKDGRIYISEDAEKELKRTLGQVLDRPFNVFRSDGKLLARATSIQRSEKRAGLRLNLGHDTFAGCTEGASIRLRQTPNGDVEVQIESSPGPIVDAELSKDCLATLENPRLGNYWQAVEAACILLETRLRNKTQAPLQKYGVSLVEYALDSKNGKLICRDMEKEREGIYHLCQGVMQALRNPSVHHKPNLSRTRARQIVGIIDLLLREIDEAKIRT